MDSEAKVVDRRLALERANGNVDLARELFGMLLNELPEHRAALHRALAGGDRAPAERAAHKLNGAAVYCGLPALERAASAADRHFKGGGPGDPATLLRTLAEAVDAVMVLDEGDYLP